MRLKLRLLVATIAVSILTANAPSAMDYVLFETGPVRPLVLSADGTTLYAVNIPDNRLEIFDVTAAGLIAMASVPVGMEPCSVAIAPDGKVWVVNHLSDSISIVDEKAWNSALTGLKVGFASWMSQCDREGGAVEIMAAGSGSRLAVYDASTGLRSFP